MKIQPLVSVVAVVALAGLCGCTSSPGTTDAYTAHQYKYVPATPDSNASNSPSSIVGKSRVEVRTREESVAVFRRPEPPPRPPSDGGRPRPPKPSK